METKDLDISKLEKLTRLKGFLDQDPDNLAILSDLISLCVELKDWDQAEELALKGLERHPTSPSINAHSGFIFLRRNDLTQARDCFQKAIDGGLTETVVLYNAAICSYSQGDFEGSLNYLSLVSPGDLSREAILLSARNKHHLGRLEGAINELKAFVENNPQDYEAHGLLALLLYDAGSPKDSLRHANQACGTTAPPPLEGLLARGSAYLESNEHDLAYRDFLTVTEEFPFAAGRAWSGIAQIEFNNLQMDPAVTALNKAVETMPNHIGTWHLLGWAYIMKNELDDALSAFERAYDIDRNFGETHGGLAAVYAMLGETDKAERHIKLAERLDPNGFASIYARMTLLNKDGKQSQANALFEKTKQTIHPVLGVAPEKLIKKRLEELATPNNNKQTH